MENWIDLYTEISEKIRDSIPEVVWIDLWHNQVNFLADEHPFRTPAVFLNFRSLGTTDLGEKLQQVNLQVDFFLFYETFADTYNGAFNQDSALEFLKVMEKIHGNFHGTAGDNYSAMRRIGFNAEDTGGAGNLYKVTFGCLLEDSSAAKYYNESAEINFELLRDEEDDGYVIPG